MPVLKKFIFGSVLVVMLAFTTEKGKSPVTDYRDAYVGSYTCTRAYTNVNDSHTALVTQNTACSLSIVKDVADSMVVISTRDGQFTMKLILPNLINTQSGISKWGNFFATDSVSVTYIPSKMGPVSFIYKGKKN